MLGREAVAKAIEEAYAEYGKDQDPRVWNIFLNGTEEERKAVREEIDRKIQEHAAKLESSDVETSCAEGGASIQEGSNEELPELKN